MPALLPKLPIWTLVDLEGARSDTAAAVGGKLLPDGAENVSELVKTTLIGMASVNGPLGTSLASLSRSVNRELARPVEWLARSRRVNFSVGNVVCIQEAARYDLVELLQLVMGELNRPNLALVRPGITFEKVKRYYSWNGLLIEFYARSPGNGLPPHYLALDRTAGKLPAVRSTMVLKVVDTVTK